MTKVYDIEEVKVTRQVFNHARCDKCGERLPNLHIYDHRKFNLVYQVGSSYPEGGSGTQWEVEDLCDKCVGDLRQLLEANGFKVADSEWDW